MQYTFDDDIISDLHKDAYGFRPRQDFWVWWDNASDDEKQAEWDSLLAALERAVKEEREQEERAIAKFETLVATTIATGAGDRETALRWIMDGSRCGRDGDWDFLCYEYGLPYGYFRNAVAQPA